MNRQQFNGRRNVHLTMSFMLLALAVILSPGFARAQSETPPPPFNGIAHFAIRVHDVDASIAFYEKLGYEFAFDLRKNDIPYESFIKINDTQFIEIYPTTEQNPNIGFLHICFEGVDLSAIHDDYASRGIVPKGLVRKAGAGNLLFAMAGPLQPFGPQNIEYTQYIPGSPHSNDLGKHLGPDRIADKLVSVSLAMQDPPAARDFYINQLNFKPIAGDPMSLHLPGNSGEEVRIAAATLGNKAGVVLSTPNIDKAKRRLRKEHIPVTKEGENIVLTDLDGNIIVLKPR
jgi:catechol 2,3-dioxygenase-like lactoylglutathione lyase family enzyme